MILTWTTELVVDYVPHDGDLGVEVARGPVTACFPTNEDYPFYMPEGPDGECAPDPADATAMQFYRDPDRAPTEIGEVPDETRAEALENVKEDSAILVVPKGGLDRSRLYEPPVNEEDAGVPTSLGVVVSYEMNRHPPGRASETLEAEVDEFVRKAEE